MEVGAPGNFECQDFIVTIDIDAAGIITFLNDTAERVFPDGSLGRSIESLIVNVQGGKAWTGVSGRYNVEAKGCIPLSMTMVVVPRGAGWRIYGGIPIFEDLIARDSLMSLNRANANLSRELRRSAIALERKSEEKALLMRFISHDLTNMASAIEGFAEILRAEQGSVEGEHPEYVDRIAVNARQILGLLRDLSELTRDHREAAGHMPVNAGDIVTEAVGSLSALALKKGIEVRAELPSHRLMINGDRCEVFRAITNLISNAIKFSGSGSEIRVSLAAEAGGVRISITDLGPGIAPEEIEDIFQPLRRGRARPTAGESSTGLGLAIVERIIKNHGGRVSVASEVGRGTTFALHFPVCPLQPSASVTGGEQGSTLGT